MGISLRGIVNLFRIVGREKEIHRQVLGFSISHTVQTVAIYAHYPFINADSKSVTFHFHEVTRYFLNGARGRDRWTSYKFALARYEHFAPELLKKLHSAIDDIPDDLDFEPVFRPRTSPSPSPSPRANPRSLPGLRRSLTLGVKVEIAPTLRVGKIKPLLPHLRLPGRQQRERRWRGGSPRERDRRRRLSFFFSYLPSSLILAVMSIEVPSHI